VAATTQSARVATEVEAATGTSDVIPAAQTRRGADNAIVADAAGASVAIPDKPTGDVSITTRSGQRFGIGIAHSNQSRDARTSSAGTTVYTDSDSQTATAVQVTMSGVRELVTLLGPDAPTTFDVPLDLPDGAHIQPSDDGGYDILEGADTDGNMNSLAHIEQPWARDANGRALPTTFSLNGNQLTQRVETKDAVFPVVADPHYTWGWISGTVYFNRSETARIARSSSAVGLGGLASFPWGTMFTLFYYVIRSQASTAYSLGGCYKISSAFRGSTMPWDKFTYFGGYCR
jgi:hypothetical protein